MCAGYDARITLHPPVEALDNVARAARSWTLAVLELAHIEPYLRDRGLISARAVVDGGLRIEDHSRLNRVFLVTAEGERGLVIKVADEPGSLNVAREAAVLKRLSAVRGKELTPFLPPVVDYDAPERVLVLEAARKSRDLTLHHARGRFSCALARQAGRALAKLHDIGPDAAAGLPDGVDLTARLGIHRPDLGSIHAMSAAAIQLTEVIQGCGEICASLDALLASWSPGSMIHGDVRWANMLALYDVDSERWTRLQLIDWELATAGDPGLDVGSFFGEYLRAWACSIPIVDPCEPGRLLAHSGLPLRRMRPALAAFWDAYTRRRRCAAAELARIRRRATRFAALRLLTAAFEEAQLLTEARASVLYMVPLSRNILMRPDEASTHLLGLGGYREAA